MLMLSTRDNDPLFPINLEIFAKKSKFGILKSGISKIWAFQIWIFKNVGF